MPKTAEKDYDITTLRPHYMVIALILFFLTTALQGPAQNTIGLPLVINYSKTDFHGGAQTWDIKQDGNGIMYFANNEGLISFDGTYWKIYPLPNRTILRSMAIGQSPPATGATTPASAGTRIYVGGQGEIGYFMPDAGGFLHYESLIDLLPKAQNKFADIWDIRILGESVFFRATDRIFELKNNSIRIFYTKSEWQFLGFGGDKLLAKEKAGSLLFYKNDQWAPIRNHRLLDNEMISGIIRMGSDSLLITTLKKRFFLLKGDSVSQLSSHPDIETRNTDIFKTEQLNRREFAAGTTSQGCLIMDFDGKIIQSISRAEGLQNNNVLSVFLDRDNNLWCGLNNGISLIAYNAAIKFIKPSRTNELAGYSSRIFENSLYIGSSDGAYTVPISPESKDLSFSKGEFSLIGHSSGQVWRLDEINQQLLMGHNDGDFVIRNREAIPIDSKASWMFLPLSSVFPSKNVLAGTYTGLKMLEFDNHNIRDLGDLEGIYESFRYLEIDNDNNIWASHPYRGIYRLELSADQKKYTARLFTDKDGLPSALNNQVFKVKNRIVFATEQGAYEFSSGRFVPSPFLSPVFGKMELRYLNEDSEGNIWFCSGKKIGVVHFNPEQPGKDFNITYFPELTGQILSGFENIYPYDNENIFIGSEKGIIHLNYKNYINTKSNLSVLLCNVKITGDRDSAILGGYAEHSAPPPGTPDPQNAPPPARFPKSYNSFHFEYSSPVYGLQSNIEFSYQLEGYDKNWSSWSFKTEKDYTNLPDGTYSFKVKAHNNLGNESAVVAYGFVIDPPFYRTIWAYILYALLFGLLLYLVHQWQERSLRIQKAKYEERQKQIIALHNLEIEKNEKEIIKLQNEKLANEVISKKIELADASMHLVEREDALTRVKEELQKLYKKMGDNHDVKIALQLLNGIEKNTSNWDQFASHFNEINNDFLKKLKSRFPDLTNSDLKICAYLKLNLSSKEITQIMNISIRGVEMGRYRLRKKLQIPTEQSLNDFLNSIV